MRRIVEVLPEAEAEVLLNSDWYETRAVSLGVQFLEDVQRALEELADEDTLTSWVPHVPRSLGARRLRLTRFPYQLVLSSAVRCDS